MTGSLVTSAVVTSSLVTSSLVTSAVSGTAAAAGSGSQALWFVSRGSGLVLLVLLTVVMSLGIATRAGWAPRHRPRFVTAELHRTLSLFTVALLGLHVVTAILDPYVTIGWAATVVPFLSPYHRLAIGLGTLAVDCGAAVLVTSVLRSRLGFRSWRAVHWLAYLAWPTAFVHALTAGNDMRTGWVAATVWGSAAALTAGCWRPRCWPGSPIAPQPEAAGSGPDGSRPDGPARRRRRIPGSAPMSALRHGPGGTRTVSRLLADGDA